MEAVRTIIGRCKRPYCRGFVVKESLVGGRYRCYCALCSREYKVNMTLMVAFEKEAKRLCFLRY